MEVQAHLDPQGVFLSRIIPRHFRRLLFLFPLLAAMLLFSLWQRPARIPLLPLVLWAWERPEDLRFINPATTGVAFLAATATLQPDGAARFHLRQQPLRVPRAASLIAVIRIESPPRYVFADPHRLADALAQLALPQHFQALQIDYDARASERSFYRALLAELRRKTRLPLGITALASWCDGDPWLDGQQLSEAVPMFFRMGSGESKNMSVSAAACTASIGLSTDETWPVYRPHGLRDAARIYVFNPHAWTKADYDLVVRHVSQWRRNQSKEVESK
jgi:hypothetical protein